MRLKTQNFADPIRYNISPGPANYSPNFKSLYRNFSYTMRSRPNTAKTDSNPGPGNYNLRTEKSLIAPTYRYNYFCFFTITGKLFKKHGWIINNK